MNNQKSIKKVGLGLIAFIAVIAFMFVIYTQFLPASVTGKKEIVAEVVLSDGTSKSYDIKTDAEYLREALEEKDLISGTESDFGLFVTTVDEITADESKQEWWCFTENGGAINTSVDETPITDGGHYEITLTVGW
ncbi:MAG: hypothetical protein K0R21_1267 [Anaerocolumna sp.]|jgi:imidazole glycerol phosphate synthase subunit HisF|nr:hypothetical protein [Anaerocolumna sp.]